MANAKEVLEAEEVELISPEAFDKVGEVISKIENSKQQTALAQIEATSKDNERQYQYALTQEKFENSRWNKAFWVGSFCAIFMGGFSVYLIANDEKCIGVGLLSTTLAAVFGYLAGSGKK